MSHANELIKALREQGFGLVSAESCTGGLLSAAITDVAGCSDVFLQGHVTYANAAKCTALQIPETLIAEFGAVSAQTAEAMAQAAAFGGVNLCNRPCLGLGTTGVAGPTGSETKPVGMVFLAASLYHPEWGYSQTLPQKLALSGSRQSIRQQAVAAALTLGVKLLADVDFQG